MNEWLLSLEDDQVFILIGSVIAAWLLLRGFAKADSADREGNILALFRLGKKWQLLGADIGGHERPAHLRAFGLVGTPDVLASSGGRRMHVGDYKNRRYRGKVRDYERYQLLLYTGMVRHIYGTKDVTASIAYKDRVVEIPWDSKTFDALIGLRPEYRESTRHWRAVNPVPLKARRSKVFLVAAWLRRLVS